LKDLICRFFSNLFLEDDEDEEDDEKEEKTMRNQNKSAQVTGEKISDDKEVVMTRQNKQKTRKNSTKKNETKKRT